MANKRNTVRGKKRRHTKRKLMQKVSAAKRIHDGRVTGAVAAYEVLQASNGGRVERQMQEEFLQNHRGVSMGMIYGKQYRIRNQRKKKPTRQQSAGEGSTSGAAEPEPVDDDPMDRDQVPPLETRGDLEEEDGADEEDGAPVAQVADEDDDEDFDDDQPEVDGALTQALEMKKREVGNMVAVAYKEYVDLKKKDPSKKVSGRFNQILSEVCKQNYISVEESGVNYEMIRKRIQRDKLVVAL